MKITGLNLLEATEAAQKGMLLRHSRMEATAAWGWMDSACQVLVWGTGTPVMVSEATLIPEWYAFRHSKDTEAGLAAREAAFDGKTIIAPTGFPHRITNDRWCRAQDGFSCVSEVCGWFMPWAAGWTVTDSPNPRVARKWWDRCEICQKWEGPGGCKSKGTWAHACCDKFVRCFEVHKYEVWPRCDPPDWELGRRHGSARGRVSRDTVFFRAPDGVPIHWADCIGLKFRGFEGGNERSEWGTWTNWFVPFMNRPDGTVEIATHVKMATS